MADWKIWLEATRPKTLPAALAPVLLASALAHAHSGFNCTAATLCLLFALFMQIGTNLANDYLDGIKGTDTADRIGPRRAVASGEISPRSMRCAAVSVLLFGFCLGLALIPFGGWWLLAVGLASVACAWCYTGGPYPLAYNGLGDLFVLLFFGLIAVGVTYYVQTGTVVFDAWLLGLGCGLLINNLLVVNNYRDREGDMEAGKNTLVVRLGPAFARAQCRAAALLAGFFLIWLSFRGASLWILLGLIPAASALRLAGSLQRAQSAEDYLRCLQRAGQAVIAYALLVSIGLLLQ
ncbi:MAG: 1,4-dihydroxy-2-naphthoate polyprenyltransferase [Coraliomargaritaceae bacterium]